MTRTKELEYELEVARKNLDDAMGQGDDPELIYHLSLEFDHLLEEYIDIDHTEMMTK